MLLNVQNYSYKKLLKLAKQARETTAHYQTRLIIANHYKIAKEIKADGVDLSNLEVCPSLVRKELYSWQIIGATSNNLETCETYISKEVDYIYLSPFESPNLKSSIEKVLNLNDYKAILETLNTKTHILAAGSLNIKNVTNILETGIYGVAISDEITQDPNIIKAYNKILNPSSAEEHHYTFK